MGETVCGICSLVPSGRFSLDPSAARLNYTQMQAPNHTLLVQLARYSLLAGFARGSVKLAPAKSAAVTR